MRWRSYGRTLFHQHQRSLKRCMCVVCLGVFRLRLFLSTYHMWAFCVGGRRGGQPDHDSTGDRRVEGGRDPQRRRRQWPGSRDPAQLLHYRGGQRQPFPWLAYSYPSKVDRVDRCVRSGLTTVASVCGALSVTGCPNSNTRSVLSIRPLVEINSGQDHGGGVGPRQAAVRHSYYPRP